MESGKRTFCLSIKWPFFSLTFKVGDAVLALRKEQTRAAALGDFAKPFVQILATLLGPNAKKTAYEYKPDGADGASGDTGDSPGDRSASA